MKQIAIAGEFWGDWYDGAANSHLRGLWKMPQFKWFDHMRPGKKVRDLIGSRTNFAQRIA